MPFDPTVPQTDQPLDATVVRDQLTSLKDLIDARPILPLVGHDGDGNVTGQIGFDGDRAVLAVGDDAVE